MFFEINWKNREAITKLLLIVLVLIINSIAGCKKSDRSNIEVYEEERCHALSSIKALNALSSGNIYKAKILLQTEAFISIQGLYFREEYGNIPLNVRLETRKRLREILTYLENDIDDIDIDLPSTKACLQSLDEMLTTSKDRKCLANIKKLLRGCQGANRASRKQPDGPDN